MILALPEVARLKLLHLCSGDSQGPRRVKKSGIKHTPMASAGARAYNGGLGVQGAESPVGVRGRSHLQPTRFLWLKQ